MGASPSRPDPKRAQLLKEGFTEACASAAAKIEDADILLVCTGAGFSADSGLAVYSDIAKIKPYQDMNLEYHDICEPHWLDSNPELFYGFWGMCYNDYRDTAPHAGYGILQSWRDSKRGTSVAQAVSQAATEGPNTADEPSAAYSVTGPAAGSFFLFTSNVDAHSFDHFEPQEIRECHGNTELWQCSAGCSESIWRAPAAFRFVVDKETMLAPIGPPADGSSNVTAEQLDPVAVDADADADASPAQAVEDPAAPNAAAPRIGQTTGARRAGGLCNMPVCPHDAAAGFESNHPRCINCEAPARPAILMFGDGNWIDDESQAQRWDRWCDAVKRESRQRTDASRPPLKVAVMEIGCGGNVTTVRRTTESFLNAVIEAGGSCHAIRINPDLPLPDSEHADTARFVSIMSGGLSALTEIDRHITQLRREDSAGKAAVPPTDSVNAAAPGAREDSNRLATEAEVLSLPDEPLTDLLGDFGVPYVNAVWTVKQFRAWEGTKDPEKAGYRTALLAKLAIDINSVLAVLELDFETTGVIASETPEEMEAASAAGGPVTRLADGLHAVSSGSTSPTGYEATDQAADPMVEAKADEATAFLLGLDLGDLTGCTTIDGSDGASSSDSSSSDSDNASDEASDTESPPQPPPRPSRPIDDSPADRFGPNHWSQVSQWRRPPTPEFEPAIKDRVKHFSRMFMMLPSRGWDEVVPGIIIAEAEAALDLGLLQQIGVTHVVNTCELSEEARGTFREGFCVDTDAGYYSDCGITYYGFHAMDASDYDLSVHFRRANKFLGFCVEYCESEGPAPLPPPDAPPDALPDPAAPPGVVHSCRTKAGFGKVLVHCKAGASRSATIVIAFLLSIGWDLDFAIDKILESREIAPNNGFLGLLAKYELECQSAK